MFEEQLAGLKALVAGKERMIERLMAQAQRAKEEEFERKPPPKRGPGGTYTPHGALCQCIACRATRLAEMEPA